MACIILGCISMRPFYYKVNMGYPGSKNGTGALQQIAQRIPDCKLFIDVFAGSAAVGNYMRQFVPVVTNDIEGSLKTDLHLDWLDLIVKYDYDKHAKTFFYFDPPYLMATRSSQRRIYNYDWNVADHERFLKLIRQIKSNCMISHYPCEMYDDALQSWRTATFQSMTRGGWRTEKLYMNYEQPQLLLTATAGGKNRSERQAINRKISRLISKINALPEDQRYTVLTAIKKNF